MLSKIKISPSDEAILEAYKKLNIKKFTVYSFIKDRGSDEAQYNYPGVDIPITSIFRTKYGKFREYHTSLDDFKLVTIKGLFGGFKVAREAIKILQRKVVPKNKILCEPNMGKRGLYPTLSNGRISKSIRDKMNFLQYADGKHSTDLISKKINLSLSKVNKIYRNLKKHDLII
jgi:aminopeptidase-like protein